MTYSSRRNTISMKIVCGHSQPHQMRPTDDRRQHERHERRERDEHDDVEVLRPEHDAEQHEAALRTSSSMSGWPPTVTKGARNRNASRNTADHRPRPVEPAGRLPRVDPPPPAVAGDAGQLVAKRLVFLGEGRLHGFLQLPGQAASAARFVALGIGRFRIRGSAAAFRQHVARDL